MAADRQARVGRALGIVEQLGGASDPVAGLVFAGPHRVDRLYVGGEEVVSDGHLVHGDEGEIARAQRREAERFVA